MKNLRFFASILILCVSLALLLVSCDTNERKKRSNKDDEDENITQTTLNSESDTAQSTIDSDSESDTAQSTIDGDSESDTTQSTIDSDSESDTPQSTIDSDSESDTTQSTIDGDRESDTTQSTIDSDSESDTAQNGGKNPDIDEKITSISFKSSLSYDYLQSLNGNSVTINGYIATSSPVNGSFIFLMNLPYQSCPFCVPNTTELSNTIEVYPKSGEKFSYTASAVKVKGTLEVAPKDKPFTDPYGYTFSFKIVDAEYEVLTSEDMGADFGVWERFSQSGIINELFSMYDYVDFVCKWNEYFVNTYTGSDGVVHTGYYLYASDAKKILEEGNKKYGTDPEYFSNLVKKIEVIDPVAFKDLVANVRQAEALAKKAYNKLYNGEYTSEYKYVDKFGTNDYIYSIIGGDELKSELNSVYSGFEVWLAGWEL